MLNRRADEVESLQKVMADTEKQFIDCLQQIKTLGEEKEKRQKELEELKAAAQELVEMVDPREDNSEGEPPTGRSSSWSATKDLGLRHQGRRHLHGSRLRASKIILAEGST
jgi:hypothetical protein